MPTTITKTIRVLHIQPPVDPGFVVFQQRDTDTDEVATRLALTEKVWIDLEWPGELTVTIEPGDLLNR